jgi:hypothetical protein
MIIQLFNGSNGTKIYKSLESALYDLGYIFSIEMLYLTIYLTVSMAGLIGNIFCVLIFYRPAFYSTTSPPLYSYLRYEAMIGIVGNLIAAVYGLNTCSDILPLTNTYASQWIQSFIAIPLYNMSYYAKFLIELVIVMDRITMLVPSFHAPWGLNNLFKIKRPFHVLIGVCISTVLINYPFIYLLYVPSSSVFVNYGYPEYHLYTYFAASRAVWSSLGMAGYYPMLFIYIFKNVFTFLIEILLNMTSLALFQSHLAKKAKLVAPPPGHNISMVETINHNASFAMTARQSHARGKNESSAGGRNMANLVLVKSASGFAHNMFLTTYTMYYLNNPKVSLTLRILQFCSYFASTLRHAINFLQFYFFNTTFRKEARIFFGKIKIVNTTARVQPSHQINNNTFF